MWTSDALDELSYDQEDDGVLVREQLERVVLARGSWATVMFLFRELDRETGAWRAPKMAVVRFQKRQGGYRKHSAFNVASAEQARELAAVLARWTPLMSDAADEDLGAEA
ncbi:MAG TPA: hypothetical protein VHL80_06085 [Polyangia bacterium]|nr:hypothetical protein [Polyangia bacterium]